MRKRALTLLFLILVTGAAYAVGPGGMTCVAGAAFRGRDGALLDCFEEAGSDCMRCGEAIVVQG